jgi:hypothetical protein
MVVGVEMGGHPLRGEWKQLEPLFAKARAAGLKVSPPVLFKPLAA